MFDIKSAQKAIYANKENQGFNTTDVHKEFCFLYEEVAEANRAYYRNELTLGEELADVFIYVMGLSEILGIDLEAETLKKIEKNRNRVYKKVGGVNLRISW